MLQFAFAFITWKVVIKTFSSLIYRLNCSFHDTFLFSYDECKRCFIFKNLQVWGGYHVPPSLLGWDVFWICLPYRMQRNSSAAISIFLSEKMWVPRTTLSIGSMTTQIQKQSCLTLICVSSIINFDIFLLLKDIFSGL